LSTVDRKSILGIVSAGILLALVSAADYMSGPSISFALFYLLIVAWVAWITQNLRVALATAIICALVWLIAEWFTLGAPDASILLWNAATRLITLLTIGIVISRLMRALDAEQALARTDFLTGALNARAFYELAEAETARALRFDHPLTLVYLDLDDFKAVNDRFGHAGGDRVLRAAAAALQASLRETDRVARVGGDEFALLLPETDGKAAEAAMSNVRTAVAGALGAHGWPVTFSIGIAAYETPPRDIDVLIKAADEAMYRAKAAGKNRIYVADATLLCTKIDTDRAVSVHSPYPGDRPPEPGSNRSEGERQ
jgi:diguanylate cyclase (GGDEF)-like protein